ncbi:MAG: flavodoxin [Plesiomonas sp.]|uniref:flavodoxin n=1 Tax=Plesiomonas sp. TaxID=2486279 RepID=UPI003EE4FB21
MARVGIFVGTVYGNAQLVADEAERILRVAGHDANIYEEGSLEDWQQYLEAVVLVVTSTTGQGDLPDTIAPLYLAMQDTGLWQPKLRYGVIALGDSSYETFCGAGKQFDTLLHEQGAQRIQERLELDATSHPEPELTAREWIEAFSRAI